MFGSSSLLPEVAKDTEHDGCSADDTADDANPNIRPIERGGRRGRVNLESAIASRRRRRRMRGNAAKTSSNRRSRNNRRGSCAAAKWASGGRRRDRRRRIGADAARVARDDEARRNPVYAIPRDDVRGMDRRRTLDAVVRVAHGGADPLHRPVPDDPGPLKIRKPGVGTKHTTGYRAPAKTYKDGSVRRGVVDNRNPLRKTVRTMYASSRVPVHIHIDRSSSHNLTPILLQG